jgi:hypothetical protein
MQQSLSSSCKNVEDSKTEKRRKAYGTQRAVSLFGEDESKQQSKRLNE